MEKTTVLVFKFDGILTNTVEVFMRRVWQLISNLDLLTGSLNESRIDHLVVMNWDKGPKFLARAICDELGAKEKVAKFERDLMDLDYIMVADFRLNEERMKMIQKLGNEDFVIALYTKRTMENLRYLSRVIGLDLNRFNHVLNTSIVSSLSQWLQDEKIGSDLVYFGNTASDFNLAPQGSVVVMPEFTQDEEIEPDYLVNYLENNFLRVRKFAPTPTP